jgi:hypothetical protein
MKLLSISFLMTVAITVNSQHAENLFRDYYLKFGLELGYREMFSKNIDYDEYMWHSVKMGGFGIQYNFYQKGNLNFRITPQYHFGVFKDEFVYFTPGWTWREMFVDDIGFIALPFETEYFFKLNDRFYFSPSVGFELMVPIKFYYYETGLTKTIKDYINDAESVIVRKTSPNERNQIPVYCGLNLGFSIDYVLRPMLLRFNVKYNYMLGEGFYRATTVVNNNGVINTSSQKITGNYAGFGVTIIPKKLSWPDRPKYPPGLDSAMVKTKKMHKDNQRFFFETGIAIMNKLKIESTGEPLLKSRYLISPLTEFGFFQRVQRSWSIKVGVGGNLIPFNENYKLELPSGFLNSGNQISHNLSYYDIKTVYLFSLIYKEFPINGRMTLSAEAGVRLNFLDYNSFRFRGFSYAQLMNDEIVNVYSSILDDNGIEKGFLSYRGAVVLNYNFKPNHIVRVGLGFNYTNEVIAKGKFEFRNLPFESYGTTSLGMNFISIPIGYSFSF